MYDLAEIHNDEVTDDLRVYPVGSYVVGMSVEDSCIVYQPHFLQEEDGSLLADKVQVLSVPVAKRIMTDLAKRISQIEVYNAAKSQDTH